MCGLPGEGRPTQSTQIARCARPKYLKHRCPCCRLTAAAVTARLLDVWAPRTGAPHVQAECLEAGGGYRLTVNSAENQTRRWF
jgi:hypothetical protein